VEGDERSLRIGFDLTVANVDQAGTGIYARSVFDALRELDDGTSLVGFVGAPPRAMDAAKTAVSRLGTLRRDLIWTHLVLPIQAARAKVDLLHIPTRVIPVVRPCPTVVTILDTTVLDRPREFPFWQRSYSGALLPFAARYARRIVTISESSRADIVRQFHVPRERVSVTPLAASRAFTRTRPEERASALRRWEKGPFILTVGTIQPRKNIQGLLRAMAHLKAAGRTWPLIHAGPLGWHYQDTLHEIDRLGLKGSVRFLGRVPLHELVALYNAASVFVYPSFYEGFGLPVLEAMACGCPVIASNTSSLPEVVGEAGLLVDPHSVEAIADAITVVMEDKRLASRLADAGLERAAEFSWRRCAQETVECYRLALGG